MKRPQPHRNRCDWHYLMSAVNGNGTVSPCCGIQDERDDFGSVTGSSFHELWRGSSFRGVRRLFATGADQGNASICSRCPFPEDQSRAHDGYVARLLRIAPRAVRKRAARIAPGLAGELERGSAPFFRRRGRFEAQRYANLLLALEEQAAGVEQPRSYPIGLILDPSSACGLRCPLCPVSFDPAVRQKTTMGWDLFEKIVDELGPHLFFVDLFNWGEPLLNKHLPRMLDKLRGYDIEIRISSSLSVAVSDDLLRSLVDNLARLTASIDGFSQLTYATYRRRGDLDLALANLERIAELKKLRRSGIVIDWQYLVFSFNEHELDEARRFAERIGVTFRPAAPFIDIDRNPDWVSTIDEYVLDRYRQPRSGHADVPPAVAGPDLAAGIDLRAGDFGGAFGDGFFPWEHGRRWMSQRGEVRLGAPEDVKSLTLRGWVPPQVLQDEPLSLSVGVGGEVVGLLTLREPGAFERSIALDPRLADRIAGRELTVSLEASRTYVPSRDNPRSTDDRRLSIAVFGLRCERISRSDAGVLASSPPARQ